MSTITIITKDTRKYWWLVAGGLTAILVLEVLALYSPQLIKKAIDLLASGKADLHSLGGIAGAIVALALGVAVLRAVGRPSMLAFGRIIERDSRECLFERVIALPQSAVDYQPASDIMAQATYDIDNMRLATVSRKDYSICSTSKIVPLSKNNSRGASGPASRICFNFSRLSSLAP